MDAAPPLLPAILPKSPPDGGFGFSDGSRNELQKTTKKGDTVFTSNPDPPWGFRPLSSTSSYGAKPLSDGTVPAKTLVKVKGGTVQSEAAGCMPIESEGAEISH